MGMLDVFVCSVFLSFCKSLNERLKKTQGNGKKTIHFPVFYPWLLASVLSFFYNYNYYREPWICNIVYSITYCTCNFFCKNLILPAWPELIYHMTNAQPKVTLYEGLFCMILQAKNSKFKDCFEKL